ncbi:hypothetical protein ACHAXR_001267, partial [Thalassiosira sp. AJA248-18]
LDQSDNLYRECCGKIICYGCTYADAIARQSAELICPFCRAPRTTSDEEEIERMKKRVEVGDAIAMYSLGCHYGRLGNGVPQDSNKALELWHRAAKLGCVFSHSKIANTYADEKDTEKAKYHWELAAMGGHVSSRYNLGLFESNAGNMNRAMKHFMISAGFGDDESLKKIHNGFSVGHVTKDGFEKALRAHKKSKDEMQSDQREAARLFLGM